MCIYIFIYLYWQTYTSLGMNCNLSGLFVVVLHLRDFTPYRSQSDLVTPTKHSRIRILGSRFIPEPIITRVLYCLTLTQLLSNNDIRERAVLSRIRRIIWFTALFKPVTGNTTLSTPIVAAIAIQNRCKYIKNFKEVAWQNNRIVE